MAKTNLQTISEIFNDNLFRIPDYQRGYSWIEKNLKDFWGDIRNLDSHRIHYTGMITVELKNDIYYIVDGQQRLTTVMILLKVLLDSFSDDDWIDDKEKMDYVKKYLYSKIGKEGKGTKIYFGYEKDNPSDIYYRTKILDLEESAVFSEPEETLYTKNLKFAKKYFQKEIQGKGKQELEKLLLKVTKQLKFNFYELDDELDEFVTFETMNNRGKPLTTLELLKNRLIYLTTLLKNNDDDEKIKLRNDINNAWKTIYEYLGKPSNEIIIDDKFLKDHWIMYFTYDRSVEDPEKEFLLNKHFTQQKVINYFNQELLNLMPAKKHEICIGYDDIQKYVFDIQKSVVQYYWMLNPEKSNFSDELQRWLSKINRLGYDTFKPLILALLLERERYINSFTEKNFIKVFRIIEHYMFVKFYTDKGSRTDNTEFFKLANKLHSKKNFSEILTDLESKILEDGNSKVFRVKKFIEIITDPDKKGWYEWKGIEYLLYEYELSLLEKYKGEQKVIYEHINRQSIEHIYSQQAGDYCVPKVDSIYIHMLGNLLLLSTSNNSSLGNKCFNKKIEHYKNSSYSAIEVSQLETWCNEEIYNRGKQILEFASTRWSIKLDEVSVRTLLGILKH